MSNSEHYIPSNVDPAEIMRLTSELEFQNERFIDVTPTSDVDDLHYAEELAREGISAEQLDTFIDLLRASQEIDYAAMGAKATEQGMADYIRQEANRLAALSPRASKEILAYAESQISQLSSSSNLEELEIVNNDIAKYGGLHAAWPVPIALSPDERKTAYEMVQDEAVNNVGATRTVNRLPIAPVLRSHLTPDHIERTTHVIENPEAARFVNEYLVANKGKLITVEELGAYLYHKDPITANEKQYRTRVTSLLGPATRGKEVQRYLLEEHGLTLQYGFCVNETFDGRNWIPLRGRQRVYRVLEEVTEDSMAPTVIIVEGNARKAVEWKKPGSREEVTDLLADELQDILEEEVNEEVDILEQTEATVEEDTETPLREIADIFRGKETQREEKLRKQRKNWSDTLRLHPELENTLWENFQSSVDDIIRQLDEDALLSEDYLRQGMISTRVLCEPRLCNQENMDSLFAAGLMTQREKNERGMTQVQRVLGMLMLVETEAGQRVFARLIGYKGRLQNRAVDIVKTQLASYIEATPPRQWA